VTPTSLAGARLAFLFGEPQNKFRGERRKWTSDQFREADMKRALVLSMGLLIVLTMATTALAQTRAATATQRGTGTAMGANFIDANGDGICDNYQAENRGARGAAAGRGGYGPGDGTGNSGVGPRDGSGFGSGSAAGTGTCDGTGPKGRGARQGRGRQ
jgi:hypothetical protein